MYNFGFDYITPHAVNVELQLIIICMLKEQAEPSWLATLPQCDKKELKTLW